MLEYHPNTSKRTKTDFGLSWNSAARIPPFSPLLALKHIRDKGGAAVQRPLDVRRDAQVPVFSIRSQRDRNEHAEGARHNRDFGKSS